MREDFTALRIRLLNSDNPKVRQLVADVDGAVEIYERDGEPDHSQEQCQLARDLGIGDTWVVARWRGSKVRRNEKVLATQAKLIDLKAKAKPKPEAETKPKVEIEVEVEDWASLKIPADANELERPTYVPGVVGETQNWIVKNAIRPNRMMALGTSLCVAGTLMGRYIEGPTYSATHLYVVHLAPSGWGKDDPLKSGDTLMSTVASHLIGSSEFASSPGFIKRLAAGPLFICFVDEFADELDKVKCQGNNAFVRNLVGTLKKCWNAFDSFQHCRQSRRAWHKD
jgi:hypothetical protein